MKSDSSRGTLLRIPLIQEKYGPAFFASLGVHALLILLILFGSYLFPSTAIPIGTGPGGGTGGDVSTVGVVDELSGGAGMVKPAIIPKPPAIKEKPLPKVQSKAIPLPHTIEPKKKADVRENAKKTKELPPSNVIPTAPEPGSGGMGGSSGGSGGGFGGGIGVSLGAGSGGLGDTYAWYAQSIERRISKDWKRPPEGRHVEIVYSFYILSDGSITGIKQEKSSGDPALDQDALRAIQALKFSGVNTPPPELRGRPILFKAQFIYPPNR
jgi:TonB family protein